MPKPHAAVVVALGELPETLSGKGLQRAEVTVTAMVPAVAID